MDPSVVQALVQQAAAAEARLAQIEGKIKGLRHGWLFDRTGTADCLAQQMACLCARHLVDP